MSAARLAARHGVGADVRAPGVRPQRIGWPSGPTSRARRQVERSCRLKLRQAVDVFGHLPPDQLARRLAAVIFGLASVRALDDRGRQATEARACLAWLFDRFPELGGASSPQAAARIAEHFALLRGEAYYARQGLLLDRLGLLREEG